jgi:hypothetical protein
MISGIVLAQTSVGSILGRAIVVIDNVTSFPQCGHGVLPPMMLYYYSKAGFSVNGRHGILGLKISPCARLIGKFVCGKCLGSEWDNGRSSSAKRKEKKKLYAIVFWISQGISHGRIASMHA